MNPSQKLTKLMESVDGVNEASSVAPGITDFRLKVDSISVNSSSLVRIGKLLGTNYFSNEPETNVKDYYISWLKESERTLLAIIDTCNKTLPIVRGLLKK